MEATDKGIATALIDEICLIIYDSMMQKINLRVFSPDGFDDLLESGRIDQSAASKI